MDPTFLILRIAFFKLLLGEICDLRDLRDLRDLCV